MRPPLALALWSIALTFVLWLAMFNPAVQGIFSFWVMMPVATTLLAALTLIAGGRVAERGEFNARNILIGVASAALLYGMFFVGNKLAMSVAQSFPSLLPDRPAQLQSIYGQGSGVPRPMIGLLLFFPIGMCEEIYWRGFVQRALEARSGRVRGLLFTIVVYTAVHAPTGNVMLIGASFVAGTFWGLVYYYTRSIVPGTISHMLWDPFIFVVAPIV